MSTANMFARHDRIVKEKVYLLSDEFRRHKIYPRRGEKKRSCIGLLSRSTGIRTDYQCWKRYRKTQYR